MSRLSPYPLFVDPRVIEGVPLGNDANSGAADAPFRTLQHAVGHALYNIDWRGAEAKVKVLGGPSAADPTNLLGNSVIPEYICMGDRLLGAESLKIEGNPAANGSVTVVAPEDGLDLGTSCFYTEGHARLSVKHLRLEAEIDNCIALNAMGGSLIAYSDINFGTFPGAASHHCFASDLGTIRAFGPSWIVGSAGRHISAIGQGRAELGGFPVTILADVEFDHFWNCGSLSEINAAGTIDFAYGPGVTVGGKKYSVSSHGVIKSGGGTVLPGTGFDNDGTGLFYN